MLHCISIKKRPSHRPSYRCSRCGEQKRGHVCIFEQHALATAALSHHPGKHFQQETKSTRDEAVQVEIDRDMTVRALT